LLLGNSNKGGITTANISLDPHRQTFSVNLGAGISTGNCDEANTFASTWLY
jgi:hypothetical protein